MPRNVAPAPASAASEEVDDDWTPRAQNFEQQQPLLQQQQLQLLRLQQEELDFEAGVVEDRRSNLSQISKDAAQVRVGLLSPLASRDTSISCCDARALVALFTSSGRCTSCFAKLHSACSRAASSF
jgi:hypothetical protein